MYRILIELLEDKTKEERIKIIETMYYECGNRRILDIIRASFSLD